VSLPASRRTELIRRQRASLRAPASLGTRCLDNDTVPLERSFIYTSLKVGKYLVSPLTRPVSCGRYAASVSIRSGRGSTTHDRVLRLLPIFDSSDEAARYATAQGLAWIGAPVSAPLPLHP